MSRRTPIAVLAAVAAAVAAVPVAAGDGGPSPGFAWGGRGIASPGGRMHYVTVQGRTETVVESIDRSGAVVDAVSLRGFYGVPYVTGDGRLGGLTRDGRRLVVAGYPGLDGVTLLAVLRTKTLGVLRKIRLPGSWSYDALSPDGRTLYLVQYFLRATSQRYLVRAYDLTHGRLYRRAVSDRTETGTMTGRPVTRAASPDGGWAYTLYVRGNGTGFVHALDTAHRAAVCVDLPWRAMGSWAYDARLWTSRDGRWLHLRQVGAGGRTAVIDTRTWRVKVSSPL